MRCKNCGDELFYLNDAIKEEDNGWKHIISLNEGYVRIQGNKGCNKPEPLEPQDYSCSGGCGEVWGAENNPYDVFIIKDNENGRYCEMCYKRITGEKE